jgi:hypothetical protein
MRQRSRLQCVGTRKFKFAGSVNLSFVLSRIPALEKPAFCLSAPGADSPRTDFARSKKEGNRPGEDRTGDAACVC